MVTIQPKCVVETIHSYPLGDTLEEVKEKYKLNKVRKLSDNENVYGCSNHVLRAIQERASNLHLYPSGSSNGVVKKLAAFYQINEENLIIGNGSEEIIRLLTRAYINPGDEAIIAEMTFPRYETNVVIEGGRAISVPLLNGVHNLTAMYEKISKNTKMIFICNPNNPTGTIIGKKELADFIKNVPQNILIILDEAYYEYVNSSNYLQSVPLLEKYANLVILRTFSKIYGLASLRIGYGIMSAPIVKELQKVKDVFNVNMFAQEAAIAALNDQEFVLECSRKNKIERDYVSSRLHALGLYTFPSQTNFIFVYSHARLVEKMTETGILVRKMQMTGFNDAFRITVSTREDNDFFLDIIKDILKERAV